MQLVYVSKKIIIAINNYYNITIMNYKSILKRTVERCEWVLGINALLEINLNI